jgi:anti-sigma B factor antagonist
MADFSINLKENGGINIIELSGYLDAHTAPELENAFSGLITDNKFKIVVNFTDLKYISSAGLGVFMAFIESVRSNSGDIKLAAMQPNVFNIFDLLGFPLLYEILNTEEEAVNKFNS